MEQTEAEDEADPTLVATPTYAASADGAVVGIIVEPAVADVARELVASGSIESRRARPSCNGERKVRVGLKAGHQLCRTHSRTSPEGEQGGRSL